MTDEVVTALSRIRSLFVIASSSTRGLAAEAADLRTIGLRLGVRYVLEGSVRRGGEKVRIAVKLSDATSGEQIWAQRFEDTLEDVFALQDQVAMSVAGVIEPNIHAAELKRTARRPLDSLSAYDLYLRAAKKRATLDKEEVLEAIELLDRAIALDPDFAPALAQAAGCHSQVYAHHWAENYQAHRGLGLAMAERAIATAGDDAGVLAQTASALMELDEDFERSFELAERATRANPGSAHAWFVNGVCKIVDGDGAAAIDCMERVVRLDPLSPLNEAARSHIAVGMVLEGRYAEAYRVFHATTRRTIRMRPVVMIVCAQLGLWREARAELAAAEAAISEPVEDLMRSSTRNERTLKLFFDSLRMVREAPAD